MKKATKAKIRSALYRGLRTFTQAFLAFLTAGPVLDLNLSVLKTAAGAGFAAVLAVANRALDATDVPTIPAG